MVLWRQRYVPANEAGLWFAVAAAVLLIVANQILQLACYRAVFGLFTASEQADARSEIKAALVGLFPASLVTAALAVWLAGLRQGRRRDVLAWCSPALGFWSWVGVILGFLAFMYGFIILAAAAAGLDFSQYTPGPNGESPKTGSAGLVKEAMFDIANEPKLFLMVMPAVVLGAPLAEELVFRGQLFAALAQSRLGVLGATLLTSGLWALLHVTEPWFSVAMIFVMGLALSALLLRFGSLWVTIVCHAVWNGMFALVIYGMAGQ
jgi:uncharacterized protein